MRNDFASSLLIHRHIPAQPSRENAKMEVSKSLGRMTVVVLGVLALSGQLALAASPQDAVKARQGAMKSVAASMKTISDYVKGAADKDAALKAAGDLGATSTKLAKMWPKGTSSADLPGVSGAKPAIWTDGAKFTDAFGTMNQGSKTLANVIKTGSTDDVKTAAAAFSKTNCGGCHMNYRDTLQH